MLGRNHELAEALWQTGWYERMLATFVDEPARHGGADGPLVPRLISWAICDTACFHLFDHTPHAFRKVAVVATRGVRQARCIVGQSRVATNRRATSRSPGACRSSSAATDERNFVKKGVVWALRGIGGRNLALHAAAMTVA